MHVIFCACLEIRSVVMLHYIAPFRSLIPGLTNHEIMT